MDNPQEITENQVIDAKRKATQADSILNNPVFIAAWDQIEKQCYEAFCSIPTHDAESLSHIRLTKSILDNVKRHIEEFIISGKEIEMAFIDQKEDKVI